MMCSWPPEKICRDSGYIWNSFGVFSVHSWSVFSPPSPWKLGDLGEFILMPWFNFSRSMYWSLPQFKAGPWVVRWEWGLSKQKKKKGGTHLAAGILKLPGKCRECSDLWSVLHGALSYSKTVWCNLGHTVFLQTQWFHFSLNSYSAVYKIFTLPF